MGGNVPLVAKEIIPEAEGARGARRAVRAVVEPFDDSETFCMRFSRSPEEVLAVTGWIQERKESPGNFWAAARCLRPIDLCVNIP
ncbi:hypothetical protein GN956_G24324 [Arapaima gigas]